MKYHKKFFVLVMAVLFVSSSLLGCSGTIRRSKDSTSEPVSVTSVVAGLYVSGVITSDGTLYLWGNGENGNIGNGSSDDAVTEPQEIMSDVASARIRKLSEGVSGAVTTDGSLYMWGTASCGEFQVTDTDEIKERFGDVKYTMYGDDLMYITKNSPIKIMDNIVDFEVFEHTCAAIDVEGNLYMWGSNTYCQLGIGTTEMSGYLETMSPEPIKVMENVTSVSTGADHVAAITTTGDLYMWGNNEKNQIGSTASYGSVVTSPQKIAENVKSVFCGDGFTAIVKNDGKLYTWGYAYQGRLGNGFEDKTCVDFPVLILENVVELNGSSETGVAITADGDLYQWGRGITEPTVILHDIVSADMDWNHLIALGSNGKIYTLGDNEYGQLGDGTTTSSEDPIELDIADILNN